MNDSSIVRCAALAPLLFACSYRPPAPAAAHAPGKTPTGVSAMCTSGAMLDDGPYRYENNQWGSDKVLGSFEQCLLMRVVGDKREYGWTWNFPGVDPSVFAYPEIIFGWKPWSGGISSDSRFPLRVGDIQTLTLEYEVDTQASGHYNLAPEIWLTRDRGGGAANPRSISAEIMFWMEAQGEARPAGNLIAHPALGGRSFELWKMEGAGDKSATDGWTLFSFKSPETLRKGSIPIDESLRYMVNEKLVNPDHFVASVEFGNEISGGSGTTWVKRFLVNVAP